MELDALQGERPMSDAHNDVVGRMSADGELLGETLGVNDQRVGTQSWKGIL